MSTAATVESYIASFPEEVQKILRKVRATIRRALPQATESISYGIPTYRLERDLLHFGGFKKHIGLYPPVRDPALASRLAKYRGEKGNLQFPLDEPIPYDLIGEIAKSGARRQPAAAKAKKTEFFSERRNRANFAAFDRILRRKKGGERPRAGDEVK
jgi:uncharacterized protein YdhG (YjbR/CyaY superfamily)